MTDQLFEHERLPAVRALRNNLAAMDTPDISWEGATKQTTKHTCGGPVFGQKAPGCPRCDELLAGAAPIVQSWRGSRKRDDEQRSREIHAHFTSEHHRSGGCGPVCTFGDW